MGGSLFSVRVMGTAGKQHIFDASILDKLDFDDLEGIKFNPTLSQKDPGENLVMRPLARDDYSNGELSYNG